MDEGCDTMVVVRSQEWHKVDLADPDTLPPCGQTVLVYPAGSSWPHVATMYDGCGCTPIWRNLREPFHVKDGDWWVEAPMPPEEKKKKRNGP